MNKHQPIKLTTSRTDQAAETLAMAFQDDLIFTRILPNDVIRLRSFTALFKAIITYSLRYGEVYTTATTQGVACWLPPGNTDVTLWRSLRTGLALQRAAVKFPAEARRQFLKMMARIDATHKRIMTQAHWYLWVLGVHPEHQEHGIGRTLLQPVLAQADAHGLPCYLETQTESNVAFYQKSGFQVIRTEEIAGQGVPLWMMVREPDTGSGSRRSPDAAPPTPQEPSPATGPT